MDSEWGVSLKSSRPCLDFHRWLHNSQLWGGSPVECPLCCLGELTLTGNKRFKSGVESEL